MRSLFQFIQRGFWLCIRVAYQTQDGRVRSFGGMIQQALVDVADLLDIQATEGETARLDRATGDPGLQELQGVEQVQYRAVVDEQGRGGDIAPGGAGLAALEEGIGGGGKEAATPSGPAQDPLLACPPDHTERVPQNDTRH